MKTLAFIAALLIARGVYAQVWSQVGSDINGEAAGDRVGSSVSMPDANTMAIGAGGNGAGTGQVKVYTWSGSVWVQKGAAIYGEAANDQSGSSVSMPDANTVAIGALNNDGNGINAGQTRVYSWSGSAWVQKGADIDGEAAYDRSGFKLSMPDANTVAIGAPANDGNGTGAGQVRVYAWNGSAWAQKGADIDGQAAGDAAGYSVSMPDANTVAIGAPYNGGNGTNAGQARVYSWSDSAWVQQGADIYGEAASDQSGNTVSMPDANTMAIGAPVNADNGVDAGQVRVYTWSGSAWMQKGADIDGETSGDGSGLSVSMPDANTVAIGAVGNSAYVGQVRVYAWSGSAWVQQGADIDGEAAGDWSGWSMSMPDANTVAIGSFGNSDSDTNAGQVRVFGNATSTSMMESAPRDLAAYPNPTTGALTLELGQVHESVVVSVENALGQHISSTQVNTPGPFTLALEGPAGVYFVAVTAGSGTLAREKVMKE